MRSVSRSVSRNRRAWCDMRTRPWRRRDLAGVVLKEEDDEPPGRRVLAESLRLLRLDPDERGNVVLGFVSRAATRRPRESRDGRRSSTRKSSGVSPGIGFPSATDDVRVDDDALDDDLFLHAVRAARAGPGRAGIAAPLEQESERPEDARAHTRTTKRSRPMHRPRLTQESRVAFPSLPAIRRGASDSSAGLGLPSARRPSAGRIPPPSCLFQPVRDSDPTKSWLLSERAGWARSIARATRGSVGSSLSRFSRWPSRPTPRG